MKEIFMDIPEYEGLYQASNLGRIRNTKTGRILKPHKNNKGYMYLNLYKDHKCRKHLVHRLVISTFKVNASNKPTVNHIDECKQNNALNNLEWATYSENNTHNGRAQRVADKKSIPVYCITNNTVYKSSAEAAKQLNLIQGCINQCCSGRQKTTGNGYQFEYYTEGDAE